MEWGDIWVPAGIVFAFQIQMVRWRVDRELHVKEELQRVPWMPPCDYLNLFSMAATAGLVFVVPMLVQGDDSSRLAFAAAGFGLSALLLIGYLVALLGHYRLFVPSARQYYGAGTLQEWLAILVTIGLATAYVMSVLPRLQVIISAWL